MSSRHKPFIVKKSEGNRPGLRPLRYAQRVKEELSSMLPHDIRDPRLDEVDMLTITSVEVTPDLRHGTVHFMLMGQDQKADDVESALNGAAPMIRRELMHRLNTKVTPHLSFKYDYGIEHSAKIHDLLTQIKK